MNKREEGLLQMFARRIHLGAVMLGYFVMFMAIVMMSHEVWRYATNKCPISTPIEGGVIHDWRQCK